MPLAGVDIVDAAPGPEDAFQHHVLRDWVWTVLGGLTPEERLTLIARHFSRCTRHEAIFAGDGNTGGHGPQRLDRAAGSARGYDDRHATEPGGRRRPPNASSG